MSTESLSKCAVIHPSPEISESPGKRLKSEPETPLEWKREEDMDLNDFRNLYDDRKEPFHYHSHRLVYKNKAQIRLDEEIEKAMAEYKERKRNLSRSDAIDPPEIVGLCGCIAPVTITDDIRPLLISLLPFKQKQRMLLKLSRPKFGMGYPGLLRSSRVP